MDVSSEVKQKPKRFKKNYGVSTISLANYYILDTYRVCFYRKILCWEKYPDMDSHYFIRPMYYSRHNRLGNRQHGKNNAYALSIDYINDCFYHCHSNMYCLHGYSSLC